MLQAVPREFFLPDCSCKNNRRKHQDPSTLNASFLFLFICFVLVVAIALTVARRFSGRALPSTTPSSPTLRNSLLGLGLAAPAVMVLLTWTLPRTGDPLHPVNNGWYFALTFWVCLAALGAATVVLVGGTKKGGAGIVVLAILALLMNLAVGFGALLLWSIQGLQT